MSMRARFHPPTIVIGILLPLALMVFACSPPKATDPAAGAAALSAIDLLTGSTDIEGYDRAFGPRQFRFPEDHGPHPSFQTEWWYMTGHLDARNGERLGFQWTVFRRALAPEMEARESDWASRQIYMGHFALTAPDRPTGERFHSFERFVRGGAGLAEAHAEPFRVAMEGWSLESVGDAFFPLRLRAFDRAAETGSVGIELELDEGKPLVLQGDRGFSRKNDQPGGASFYYSFTRLRAAGSVRLGDQRLEVTGEAWLDREWSTSVLSADQVGWDWFSLQLVDGRELMIYGLRQRDGAADPFARGMVVEADGSPISLPVESYSIEVLDHWQSPRSGGRYPARWRIRVPEHDLDLEVVPSVADQEHHGAFRYWEGSVEVRAADRDRDPLDRESTNGSIGRGYVELVGYAEAAAVD